MFYINVLFLEQTCLSGSTRGNKSEHAYSLLGGCSIYSNRVMESRDSFTSQIQHVLLSRCSILGHHVNLLWLDKTLLYLCSSHLIFVNSRSIHWIKYIVLQSKSCDCCPKTFSKSTNRCRYVRTIYSSVICDMCGTKLNRQDIYKTHIKLCNIQWVCDGDPFEYAEHVLENGVWMLQSSYSE